MMTFTELLERQAAALGDRIRVMKKEAQDNWLRALGKNDFKHSQNIENYLDRLVPDNIKETFDPGEIFVLLYSVYLHDLGYLLGTPEHQRGSYDEIGENFQKYKLNDEFEAKAVATVCYAHAPEDEVALKTIDRRYGIASLSNNPLNLQFLAALFRLADEIDNAYTRVVGVPTQRESMRHRVRFVDIDAERWMICFQTEPRSGEEWEKLDGMRKYTQGRLNELAWVIEQMGLKYRRIELLPEDSPFRDVAEKRSSAEARRRVLSIFSLKGYRNIQENVRIGGTLWDLYCELPIPDLGAVRTVVQCYKEVDQGILQRSTDSLRELRDHADRLFIVSESDIPDVTANQERGTRQLTLRAMDDLLSSVIDFEHYLDSLIEDYERDEISQYYVDLGCEEREDSKTIHYPSIHTYVSEFLTKGETNHILLLGDYGSGKTSFCRRYAHDLAMQYKTRSRGNRIPILISLRDYSKAVSLEQLITDFLVNRFKLKNATFESFSAMNEAGLLLLIFDGFDEMAQKVEPAVVRENFKELNKTVTLRSKVIITCRTEFFRSSGQIEEVLSWEHLGGEQRPRFQILYLRDLQPDNVRQVLRRRVGATQAEAYFKKMEEIENLMDLARRPVLLSMIIESWRQLVGRKKVRAVDLYQEYTDSWLDRDVRSNRALMTKDDKIIFMEELAFEMYLTDKLSFHYSEMPEKIRQVFRLENPKEIDYFAHDVMTCSFLNRDDAGNYSFAHKSFMEYFVASRLVKEMQTGTFEYFRRKALSASVLNFIKELTT